MGTWGSGVRSVLLFKGLIEGQLAAGTPLKQIYRHLQNQGVVDVAYNSFRRQVILKIGSIKDLKEAKLEKSVKLPIQDDSKTLARTIPPAKQKDQNNLILVAPTKRY